jgi:hypothetical protein
MLLASTLVLPGTKCVYAFTVNLVITLYFHIKKKCCYRDTVWGVLTGQGSDNLTGLVMHEVKEIETWILRLLSAPVPVPGKTRVEASNILSATSTFFFVHC